MRSSVPLAYAGGRVGLGEVFAVETGLRISRTPDTVRHLGFAFLCSERWESLERRDGDIEGAPGLAVEVVSPSDSSGEVHEKALEWPDAGVRLLWVLHPPGGTATVYPPDRQARLLDPDDVLDGGTVVRGSSIRVRALFE